MVGDAFLPVFSAVMARVVRTGGIGLNGSIPWNLPDDRAHFARVTTDGAAPGKRNAVVMGYRTWASIPESHRPLRGRLNAVVCDPKRPVTLPEGVRAYASLQVALAALGRDVSVSHIFVIGGARLYEEAMAMWQCISVHVTEILTDHDCDCFVRPDWSHYELVRAKPSEGVLCRNGTEYRFCVFKRCASEPTERE